MQAPERTALMPSEGVLALHELHRSYASFADFQPELPALLQQGTLLDDCITVTRALGILEPLTGEHIPPEALLIQGPNWRESLMGNGLLSRNRACRFLSRQDLSCIHFATPVHLLSRLASPHLTRLALATTLRASCVLIVGLLTRSSLVIATRIAL